MSTHKVFYFSHAPQSVYEIIREEVPPGFELISLNEDSDDERKKKLAECAAVIVAARPMTREFIEAAPGLKLLHHQGVGYQDTVDVAALKERQIALALTPAGTSIGVAEHTLLLSLAVCKRLPYADSELRQGRWHINSLRPYSFELNGRTVGYVGMGRIGQETAARFKAFGTAGIYYDPHAALSPGREEALGLSRVEFNELLAAADILTLHVPSGDDTYHMIDEDALKQMKPNAIVINTARGTVIDEAALCKALQEGRIAGAGLDVFETEPFQPDNPLAAMPNVVLTPHISAGTRDALKTKMRALFQNVQRFFNGDELENRVKL
ncbi:D-3-phosphoglycerate dehydrogenase (EC [Olavius sp. associated proteobacterium Delta 1]|nr:D-3-phosphoglycerate dehydrogenase (EC [Olavius sp. associated proteobacterium Delta 1]